MRRAGFDLGASIGGTTPWIRTSRTWTATMTTSTAGTKNTWTSMT